VKFIFQPAEEDPADRRGRRREADDRAGLPREPEVGAIFGLHVDLHLSHREIGYRSGR
jgi:metal-dependent amidase/aminoacylase/carboxypeptidase family protein